MLKVWRMVLALLAAGISPAAAAMADYIPAFEIDLQKDELPTIEELKKYFYHENTLYDTHYDSVWDVYGVEFDRDFYSKLKTYGHQERRLKTEDEELILQILTALPKSMYPYIGPMLFTIPNMSEKVLNLPGIKETKNVFPERIAEELKDIEDLEFLSPGLYYLLMPEVWPGHKTKIEMPQKVNVHPKVVYDRNFYRALRKIVNPEKFMSTVEQKKTVGRSDMRTINPEKDSLLTSADVKAFINTYDGIEEWAAKDGNLSKVFAVTTMWLTMDQQSEDPHKVPVPGLKDIVNPCARLVQKVTIMGRERELAMIAAGEGLTLNEWAYTCDKVIKAYRVGRMSSPMVAAIKIYQKGLENKITDQLSPWGQSIRYATMQAIIEMYKAPLNDVVEVRKNRRALFEKFKKHNFKLVGAPVVTLD